jgi:hypothetical protein
MRQMAKCKAKNKEIIDSAATFCLSEGGLPSMRLVNRRPTGL